MKQQIAFIITAAMLLCAMPAHAAAEPQEFSVAEKIRSFQLTNNPPTILKNMQEENRKEVEYITYSNMAYKMHQGYEYTEENTNRRMKLNYERWGLIPEKSYCFYPLITTRYAEQYAKSGSFDALINADKKIWTAACNVLEQSFYYYEKDMLSAKEEDNLHSLSYIDGLAVIDEDILELESAQLNYIPDLYGFTVFDEASLAFLAQPEEIEQMVRTEIDEEIVDCKIIMIPLTTILYLKGAKTDYGIKLYSHEVYDKEAENLKLFQIFEMSELMASLAKYGTLPHENTIDEKPTYDAEMQTLMDDGLLQGTNKGTDPLKPLSRLEATTILVRALGLENETAAAEPMFADIELGSWGVKYANIAYDKGIARGVGDGLFAPDERISAEQFATLVLRNSQTEEFDWTQAVNLLIEHGIITQENADTMDLFTRADMAKIIYEAREKGLLN